jgi:16S rRNA C967 or C1407 C5-methylase (RsmB/RsmF family)
VLSLSERIEALRKEGIFTPTGAERLQNFLTPEGFLRLLPGEFHTDGFFVALIERVA